MDEFPLRNVTQTPFRYVAGALGNTLSVIQKHYFAWSKTRQSQLDEAAGETWQDGAVLKLLNAKKPARVN